MYEDCLSCTFSAYNNLTANGGLSRLLLQKEGSPGLWMAHVFANGHERPMGIKIEMAEIFEKKTEYKSKIMYTKNGGKK